MEPTNPLPGMVFIEISGGSFQMGSESDHCYYLSEKPVHKVSLGSFAMMTTPVTQAQWRRIMKTCPSSCVGDDLPVEQVTWFDVQTFIEKLNEFWFAREGYRLPTEAEWEYACRAGSTTAYCFGDEEERLVDYAWYNVNSGSMPHPVGQKLPNAWGLFDMHGNVNEWCQDKYDSYSSYPRWNPIGAPSGFYPDTPRVLRGGNWRNEAGNCRSASRGRAFPYDESKDLGFRLVWAPRRPSTPF